MLQGVWLVVVAALLAACGGDADEDLAETRAQRADQARTAALDAGLGEDVAEFLALAARAEVTTYRVRYPGPTDGTELVVTNRPPDRRVDVIAGGEVTEVRLVTEGEAFECAPADADGAPDGSPELACERTDALVEPPGVFSESAIADLRDALAERLDDYTFELETSPIAGIEARCLITRLRPGRDDARLGEQGTICVSAEGALVLVDQGDERLEALDYGTDVDDRAFVRPDLADDAEG